jgi:hypothetical protein
VFQRHVKPEERPIGRPRHRWEDNIKMDVREIGWVGMDWMWIKLGMWRVLVDTVYLWVP